MRRPCFGAAANTTSERMNHFLGRWAPRLLLFVLLLLGMFIIRPDGTTKAAMCSLGFSGYCTAEDLTPPPGWTIREIK
jgi:hypothetical protein